MKRVIVITGSTRGIGFATATEFLKQGDRVVIFCRHKAHVEEARRQLALAAPKENILGLVGNVRNSKDVKHLVVQSMKRFGRIDILINNAGIGAYKEIERVSEKEWDDILGTNLKGDFPLYPAGPSIDEETAKRNHYQYFFRPGRSGRSKILCLLRLEIWRRGSDSGCG